MKVLLKLIRIELVNLKFIDLLVFSVFININSFKYFSREIQILLSALIVRKALIEHVHLQNIKQILFLSGVKIKKAILLNIVVNNFIFIITLLLFLFINSGADTFFYIENFIILNFLICIATSIKYILPFNKIRDSFLRNLLQSIIYFILFSLIFLNHILSIVLILIFYVYIYQFFNRTFNYDDIN